MNCSRDWNVKRYSIIAFKLLVCSERSNSIGTIARSEYHSIYEGLIKTAYQWASFVVETCNVYYSYYLIHSSLLFRIEGSFS